MSDDQQFTRRTLLAAGAGAVALAGCTGEDEPDAGGDGGGTPEETPTETATPTETPTAPTLEEFEYPEGASVEGVDGGTLAGTHRDAVTGAGSITVELSEERDYGEFTESVEAVKRWGDAGVSVTTEDQVTETLWSPADERAGYVQMDTGFEQRYRIDNRAPSAEEVTEVPRFEHLVEGVAWSEATEVIEDAAGEYAVVYESTGVADESTLRRLVFGEVSDLEATIAVSQAGHVSEASYDITVEREENTVQQTAEATVTGVGETDLEAPSWLETAKEQGVRFELGTVDGEVVELEMVNGMEVPGDARLSVSSEGQFGSARLPEPVSVGDVVYASFNGDGSLLIRVGERPAESSPLGDHGNVAIRHDQFKFFEESL